MKSHPPAPIQTTHSEQKLLLGDEYGGCYTKSRTASRGFNHFARLPRRWILAPILLFALLLLAAASISTAHRAALRSSLTFLPGSKAILSTPQRPVKHWTPQETSFRALTPWGPQDPHYSLVRAVESLSSVSCSFESFVDFIGRPELTILLSAG